MLGLFPSRYLAPTANGQIWQQRAGGVIDRGDQLVDRDEPASPQEIDALGPLLVLVPGGLSLGARTAAIARRMPPSPDDAAARRRQQDSATAFDTTPSFTPTHAAALGAGSGAVPTDLAGPGAAGSFGLADPGPGGGADPFSALDGLGDALGGFLDDALSGIDSAVDGIGAGLDSAIDSLGDLLDSAIDSIDSAIGSIDTAIDSGISDGGGFGGDSGGGGDGGGGGGGGGD